MGKASRKKQSSSQAGKPESTQADKQETIQADRPTSQQAGKPASHQAGKQTSRLAGNLVSRQTIHLIIIFAIGFLAYSNTFHGPFQWDEADYIVNNPFIKSLDYFMQPSRGAGLLDDALVSRYIGYLTFALNYQFDGLNVTGYHIVNLVIHLINAMLVYFFVLLTFRTPFFLPPHPPLGKGGTEGGVLPLASDLLPIAYSRFFALAVALLFVSHPVQTEAVTYVFQRFASLVGMFYMLSLVLYIKGRLGARGNGQEATPLSPPLARGEVKGGVLPIAYRLSPLVYYSFSLISAVLAMKTKENAFTLPVMMTLYEFLFFRGPVRSRLLRLTPFLLTMIIIPYTIISTESGHAAGEIMSHIKNPLAIGYEQLSRTDYLFTQFKVIVTYIRLLFLPLNQNIDYTYPLSHSFFEPRVLLSFIFLTSLFAFAVYLIYKSRQGEVDKSKKLEVSSEGGEDSNQQSAASSQQSVDRSRFTIHDSRSFHYFRLVAFGILWFFITLSVESSVIPIPMVINEYRIYLPSAGFFLALVAGVILLLKQSSRFIRLGPHTGGFAGENGPAWGGRFTKIAAVLFALIIIGLASATYARNTLWTDKVSLWEDAVRKSPNSPRGYNNLGIAYYEKGMYDKAIGMYQHVISLLPFYQDAHVNLGVTYATTGRVDEAIEEFKQGIALDPQNSVTYVNLAIAYINAGQPGMAVENYRKAIQVNPYETKAYHGLGTAYVRLGKFDDAIATFTEFVTLSPNDPEAYKNRGIAHAKRGDFISASVDFQKACSLGSREGCNYLQDPRFR